MMMHTMNTGCDWGRYAVITVRGGCPKCEALRAADEVTS